MKNLALFLTLLLVCSFNMVMARPATPKPFHIQQSDNTTLTLHLRGDEFCHYFSTTDNVPVIKKEDNCYYYARVEDGTLVASDLLAHNPEFRGKEDFGFIEENRYKVQDHLNLFRNNSMMAKARANASSPATEDERFCHIGQKKMLIILVEFPNKAMKHSRDVIDDQFNLPGYCQDGHIGSVHDYFLDQSYGNFDLTFDVVGPFVTKENMKHYGQNNWYGNDQYVGELVTEAVLQADEFVDFNDYDWDGDGEVDQVFIIYAGFGESSGASANTIWPHQYWLTYCKMNGDGDGPVTLDGVVIDKYACANELSGTQGSQLDGIGAFCHEFSHCLGLPDFYDTESNTAFGMSYWDVMDAGNYNGPDLIGEIPTGYSAYERWKCGWLDYIELDWNTHIDSMPCIADEPVAYLIQCDQSSNEYLLLENRQNRDWFTYVCYSVDCHGMFVTHVDYKKSVWNANTVNNSAKHQRMSFIPADNNFSYYTDEALEGDLFPGSLNVTELTPQSHTKVGGMWFAGSSKPKLEFDKYLLNITEENEHISFDFRYDYILPVPSITSVEVESESNVRVRWESTEYVDFYEVEISEDLDFGNDTPDEDDNGENSGNDTSDENGDNEGDENGDDTPDENPNVEDNDNGNDAPEVVTDHEVNPIGLLDQETKPVFTLTLTVEECNECLFEELASGNYKVRIRGNYRDIYSEWTDYEYVTIDYDPTGILNTETDGEGPIAIYTLQGIRVNDIKAPGLYLIKYPNRIVKRYLQK